MTEKKYILTQSQIDEMCSAALYANNSVLALNLRSLKPVEPMTTGSIAKVLSLLPIPPSTGAELHDWAESLARAIERHILGELK